MTQRVEELYKIIKDSNKELEEIRNICQHDNHFEGMYEFRVGSYHLSKICSDCGKFLELVPDTTKDKDYVYTVKLV